MIRRINSDITYMNESGLEVFLDKHTVIKILGCRLDKSYKTGVKVKAKICDTNIIIYILMLVL